MRLIWADGTIYKWEHLVQSSMSQVLGFVQWTRSICRTFVSRWSLDLAEMVCKIYLGLLRLCNEVLWLFIPLITIYINLQVLMPIDSCSRILCRFPGHNVRANSRNKPQPLHIYATIRLWSRLKPFNWCMNFIFGKFTFQPT